jgi:hypothetical protein
VGTLRGEGTYSPTAVTGRQEGDVSFKGVIVRLKAEMASHHIGECSAPKPFDTTLEDD